MKILVISSTAIPHLPWADMAYGGIEILNWELAEGLAKHGHQVALACQADSKVPEGVEFVQLSKNEDNIGSYFKYANRLGEFDAVHVGNHLPPIYQRKEIPFIAIRYDPQDRPYESPQKNAVLPSKYSAEKFEKLYGLKSRVVNFGVNPDHYHIGKKTDRLVHLGAAIPQKGSFEAMGIAKRQGMSIDIVAGASPVKFSIDYGRVINREVIEVGNNPSIVEFSMDLRNRDNGDTLKVHYNVSNQEKAEILSHSKAMIFPTWQKEAWTLSVIEAMMSGCPIITYNYGAYPEIVEHGKTGFLCRNVLEMERYLKQIDTIDPEVVREEAIRKFSMETMVNRFEGLYEDVHGGVSW